MGGPTNFNHNKVYRPIINCKISNAQWYEIYEQIEVPSGWTIERVCPKCDELTALRASRKSIRVGYHEPQGWTLPSYYNYGEKSVAIRKLAKPGESVENIWVSGSGAQASMFRWDEKWWIVYGTRTRNNSKHDDKIIILHEPLVEAAIERLEETRISLIEAVTTWNTYKRK